jgi:hypothetical protein
VNVAVWPESARHIVSSGLLAGRRLSALEVAADGEELDDPVGWCGFQASGPMSAVVCELLVIVTLRAQAGAETAGGVFQGAPVSGWPNAVTSWDWLHQRSPQWTSRPLWLD